VKNIYETIKDEARCRSEAGEGDRSALRDGECTLTYTSMFVAVDSLAVALASSGVGRSSRVVLLCGDGIDYVVASLAVLSLAGVIIPVAAASSKSEVDEVRSRIDADYLFYDRKLWDGDGCPMPVECRFGRHLSLSARHATAPTPEFVALNPAFVRFSSGTTGTSKGVLLSHETVIERTDAADRGLEITSSDTVLWVLSMSYHFVVSILLFLRRGATIRLCHAGFPLGLLDAVKEGDGTFIYAAPFHYHTMCQSSGFAPDSLRGIRMALSTAIKLENEVALSFAEKFGCELAEAYGIIEVGLPFVNRADRRVQGAVGHILPDYEMKLENRGDDGIGEICIRGKGMFDAYLSPWCVHAKDEWFQSGDLGRIDDSGALFIVGRRKSVINFMGMKVFPDEVEAILNAHPAVKESLVYAVPHARYGQLPYAWIVRATDIDVQELKAYCCERLSPYKVPKGFGWVDTLPRTKSGKLRRDGTSRMESIEERGR